MFHVILFLIVGEMVFLFPGELKAPTELEVEFPSVRLPVLGIHIVGTVAVIESDHPDRLDEKPGAESIRSFEVEEIRVVEVGKHVSTFRKSENVDWNGVQR